MMMPMPLPLYYHHHFRLRRETMTIYSDGPATSKPQQFATAAIHSFRDPWPEQEAP